MTLTELGRFPDPCALPADYDRHHPSTQSTRETMARLAGEADWAKLPWPELLDALAALGRADIPLARLTEGHVDAVRILAEAGRTPEKGALYAVWASRSQRTGLTASRAHGGWDISGTLRFASGAGIVDRALIPVWTSPDEHLLLDVDVREWVADGSAWQTRAMEVSRSHTYVISGELVETAAQVGEPGFYLGRRSFFLGGIGVAAVWTGGAARLLDLALDYGSGAPRSASRSMRLGQVRTDLAAAQAIVAVAGLSLTSSAPRALGDPRALATLARTGVSAAVERVLGHVRRLAGPAGLAYATDLTRAVDDLDLYVRQLNPDSDAEYLGDLAH